MVRRNAMARRLLVLACIFLAVIQLASVYGQETSNDGMVENADDDADIDVDAAADDLADAGVAEVDTPEVPAESSEDVVDVIVDGDEEDLDDDAASDAAASASTKKSVGGFFAKMPRKAKTGNKLCGWSWKERRCTPADLCQYKYQFLDAIPSESCRLKGFSLSRKVFKTSDVEVKPAVALAGAAGLFATDLAAIRYTSWLERFPVLFNVVQGFVLFVSGDTLFQVVEQGWKEKVGLRFWRMARSGLIGALNNGLVHYTYYKWIDRRFPYDKFTEKRWGPADGARSKLAIGFTKWAIEWPTVGIYKIASMYILTAAMSGSMKGLWERMGDSFFLTWLRSLQVWPIYDMILYAYVPTAHRPLFNSFMSIAWGGYLSHVSQPHEEDEHGEDIAEATS